jgi:hypothetical protein
MHLTVCLNVIRHLELPVARGKETYEQFIDLAWRAGNDDIHPEKGPSQVASTVPALLLDPNRPLVIRHSPAVRTRKGAALFRAALDGRLAVTVREEPALLEPVCSFERLMSREEFERPDRPRTAVLFAILRAIAADDASLVEGGRNAMAARVEALQRALAADGPVNHLWVSHAPVMPFIRLGVIECLPPEQWTAERAIAIGLFDYARGFSERVVVDGCSRHG